MTQSSIKLQQKTNKFIQKGFFYFNINIYLFSKTQKQNLHIILTYLNGWNWMLVFRSTLIIITQTLLKENDISNIMILSLHT